MPVFRVSSRVHGTVDVEAANWLIAMGEGFERLGVNSSPDRIACERLPNGTFLVRDVRSGEGFSVQPVDAEVEALPDESSEELFSAPPDEDDDEAQKLDFETEDAAPASQVVHVAVDSINRAMDVEATIGIAVSAGVRLTRALGGSALLRDGDSLRFRYVVGEHAARLRTMRIPATAGVAGYSVGHGTALIVQNAYADPRFYRNVDRHTGHRTRTLLCVPITGTPGRSIGCIEMVDTHDPQGFTDEQLGEMVFIATAVANRLSALGVSSPRQT